MYSSRGKAREAKQTLLPYTLYMATQERTNNNDIRHVASQVGQNNNYVLYCVVVATTVAVATLNSHSRFWRYPSGRRKEREWERAAESITPPPCIPTRVPGRPAPGAARNVVPGGSSGMLPGTANGNLPSRVGNAEAAHKKK